MKTRQELLESLRRSDGTYAIRDVVAVTEFRGREGVDYPDVPVSEAVNLEALTEDDDKPFYVTLRIGDAGVTSGNLIHYDDEFVNELVRQVVTKRPTGGMGHIRNPESDLPASPLNWVGAVRKENFGWGKAYVAPGEVRAYLRRRGATNSEVATSIYGYADELAWDEEHEALRIVLHDPDEQGNRGFTLEYIDIASPERAGVPSLAAVPKITSELQREEEADMPTKLEIIQAMTADDAKLLPDAVVQAVQAAHPAVTELETASATLAALRTALALDEGGDLVAAITTLTAEQRKAQAAAVEARMAELVNDEKTGVKVPSARPYVLSLLKAAQPGTVEEANAAFERIMEQDETKAVLKEFAQHAQGPNQRRPVAGDGSGKPVDTWFPVDASADADA